VRRPAPTYRYGKSPTSIGCTTRVEAILRISAA
jgi:hypothetical protein